jgi:MAPEG family
MTRDQRTVAIGAGSGVLFMLLAMWVLTTKALPAPAEVATVGERLAYAARWLPLAALPLFLMLAAVGNARFLGEAIDPTLGKEDRKTLINGRVADNTLQQFALFVAGSLGLAASVPPAWLQVTGAAAIVFAVCRIAFWIGYRIHPLYRAFGFSSTAYLNLGLLIASLWLAFV